ncbi:MAG: hypothetical protein ACPGTU_08075 [Myxococcota bacterium]
MASFRIQLSDHRGSRSYGPFSGATVIGAEKEFCQIVLPNMGLEKRHVDVRPTQVHNQVILAPCTRDGKIFLWRQGQWWPVEQPCAVAHGESFRLNHVDGATFQVVGAESFQAATGTGVAKEGTGGLGAAPRVLALGAALLILLLIGGLAVWMGGHDELVPAATKKVKRFVDRKPKKRTIEFIENRQFQRNSKGDPRTEMDRWTQISGDNNYRSAKIHSFEQLKFVKQKYGIETVVNLAMDSMSEQQDSARSCGGIRKLCEPIWARELGLRYETAYLGNKPPEESDWEMIQDLLREGNTLVHCTHGVDRTGAVVGKWQHIVNDDLSEQEVLDYTYSFGGQWRLPGDPNRYLRAWMVEDIR